MDHDTVSAHLNGLEWFGLISGSIGLIVDVVALASIMRGFGTESFGIDNLTMSTIAFASVFYTAVIIGFYTRRVLCVHGRQKFPGATLTREDYMRIRRSSLTVTYIVAAPLLAVTSFMLFTALQSTFGPVYSSGVTPYQWNFLITTIGGGMVPILVDSVADSVYKGFDLDYTANWDY